MNASAGASPYSTGGGGTVFEHHYGAVLLSHLLTATPVPGLGDEVTPVEVRFQARAVAAVDDYLVIGNVSNGPRHSLSVAVRRRPKLAVSDPPSVKLMTSLLTTLQEQWALLKAGRWHLALAVASPFPRAEPLQNLAKTAVAAAGSFRVFRDLMAEPKRLNKTAHRTFRDLEALVAGAVNAGAPDSGLSSYALAFRLLAHLSILDLRLEGIRPVDRTAAVERLQPIAAQGAAADGSALFSRLRECASDYAPTGAIVTRESLFQVLASCPLAQAPSAPTPPDTPRPHRGRAAIRRAPHTLWTRADILRPGARQPRLHGDTLLVVDGHVLHGFDAKTGHRLWTPKPMGRDNQPPVDGTTVFTSGMRHTLRPRDIRSGAETGPRLEQCAAAQATCDRGTLYMPDLTGTLHAYDTASGQHLWDWRPEPTAPGFLETPRVVDDTVFVTWSCSDSSRSWALQALNAETSKPRWREPLRLCTPQHWSISDDRVVTVAPEPGAKTPRLGTYDLHSGNLLWQQPLRDLVVGSPTSSGKSFHLAHPTGQVSSWDAVTGEHRWTVKVAHSLRTGPVEADKRVLVTSWDPGRLIALDAVEGSVAWRGAVRPTSALLTPAYLAGDSAWAVSRAGVLQGWALATGRRLVGTLDGLLWDPDVQDVPLLHGKVLYAVTRNGVIHAISLDAAE